MNSREQFKEEFKRRIYNFILRLIEFIDCLPDNRVCRIIENQLLRSGTSIGGNYFEAQSASSRRDFINYFNHSLKSANESKFWLTLLKDVKKANTEEIDILLRELLEIANIFATSILTLKRKNKF